MVVALLSKAKTKNNKMEDWKNLTFEQQQKYGRLAFKFLANFAEEIVKCDLEPDADNFAGSVELFYSAQHKRYSSGVKDLDPRRYTAKTIYIGELSFSDGENDLNIPFDFETETPY